MTLKDDLKSARVNIRLSFLRFKALFKDKYMRVFFLLCNFFGVLFLYLVFRKSDSELLVRFFACALTASFFMLIMRNIYVMCFVSTEKLLGRSYPGEVSFRVIFRELWKLYNCKFPEWLDRFVRSVKQTVSNLKESFRVLKGKYKVFCWAADRFDMNYFLWFVMFVMVFFRLL